MYLIQIKDELNNYFILNIKYMSKFYYRFKNHALKLIDADLCLLKASWFKISFDDYSEHFPKSQS